MDKNKMSYEELRVRNWIMKNKGILTRIALKCGGGVSPQFVQQIAYGKSTALPNHAAEIALKKAGWPGIRRTT